MRPGSGSITENRSTNPLPSVSSATTQIRRRRLSGQAWLTPAR